MYHPILRAVMWICAFLAPIYFVGLIIRSFLRFYRDGDKGFGWLADLWSAVVISTVLGAAAVTIWLVTSVPPAP
jgi:hypothetical protein